MTRPAIVTHRWADTGEASERVTDRRHEIDYGRAWGLGWLSVHDDAHDSQCPRCAEFLAQPERQEVQ